MENSVGKAKLYSPRQVGVSAFVGGPFAAVYVLKRNYDALGDKKASRQILIGGIIFNVILFAMLPFLPDRFPGSVIPIAYTVSTWQTTAKHQIPQAVKESLDYEFKSNWNVLGISLGWLVVFLLLCLLWIMGLEAIGLVEV